MALSRSQSCSSEDELRIPHENCQEKCKGISHNKAIFKTFLSAIFIDRIPTKNLTIIVTGSVEIVTIHCHKNVKEEYLKRIAKLSCKTDDLEKEIRKLNCIDAELTRKIEELEKEVGELKCKINAETSSSSSSSDSEEHGGCIVPKPSCTGPKTSCTIVTFKHSIGPGKVYFNKDC